jgi:predicted metal-dependent phosphoesterase TrpH
MMKRLFAVMLLCFTYAAFFSIVADAQRIENTNPNKQFIPDKSNHVRNEVVIPDFAGYKVLKGDFHIHTVFSDGVVWPTYRIQEAWRDGLDILAISDHIEYRPHSQYINADRNTSMKIAAPEAEKLGILLVPATEVTREQGVIGHFNAIFIKDAELMNLEDPKEALREARRQGAFIFFNHPGWKMDTLVFSPFQKELLEEGLIDGVEAVNGFEFYPRAISWCKDLNLTLFATSDAHDPVPVYFKYDRRGAEDVRYRPMTLVLAKDKTLEAVREALDARRTIGSYHGYLIGMFDLLEGLFDACVSTEKLSVVGKNTNWQLRNNSSLIFRFRIGSTDYILLPFTSCTLTRTSDITSVDVTVLNMYHYENTHPVFKLELK